MRDSGDFDHAVEGKVEHIAGAKAVSDGSELLHTAIFEASDDLVQRRTRLRLTVAREPSVQVELRKNTTEYGSAVSRLRL